YYHTQRLCHPPVVSRFLAEGNRTIHYPGVSMDSKTVCCFFFHAGFHLKILKAIPLCIPANSFGLASKYSTSIFPLLSVMKVPIIAPAAKTSTLRPGTGI